jgi:hypothetical protein
VRRAAERERDRDSDRRVSAPESEDARHAALLALQRSAGNQAVTRALLHRAPADPPAGVTLPADPLPAGANVADPDKARVTADPSLPGGWTDPRGNT